MCTKPSNYTMLGGTVLVVLSTDEYFALRIPLGYLKAIKGLEECWSFIS